MIDSSRIAEKFLQKYRFRMVIPYLKGDVLDFGGNKGELRSYVKGNYTVMNYDHTALEGMTFDTIVALAVLEHIHVAEIFEIFKKFKISLRPHGRIFLTTPTRAAKPILELLAHMSILDKENITEHKHYWNRQELYDLADKSGFIVKKYKKFQFGMNQLAVLEHASTPELPAIS
ncbi:MAG: hypothetical protein A2677_02730 [Candidatus Komeilibacteria bacterium RIFCSPHIGHO2_01_FULL_52_14]|uniref:Methyltransferase type 11 domain-containing protein n=1 Tax=Candidatus Komeilibacteria bacterium RIFCSPHIGHO2_01_FULL_52_14 TaxID=1798549 RepID=A0A1G2BL23_9BACT|nr:MAG: hypothetical protein A2677_02730 [Candidatus Komeilibacteria bacterium RIFCSPHIGHO2_01_FULL_52_14]